MKKKLFTLMFALVAIATTAQAQVVLNAENFPDANFRKALASILGISEGDEITEAKIAATTSIDVSKSWSTPAEEKISDLTGIEHFTALTRLYCYNNQLTSLDVSKNTALTRLYCYNNQLTALDVSKNTALEYLECYRNQLTALDVSKNTALIELDCSNNQLTSLDVSKNTKLVQLSCGFNLLTELDVSKNFELGFFNCSANKLTELNVSNNNLGNLNCCYNQLTSIDVSKNTELHFLYCEGNQLTALDVSKNTALTVLTCYQNQLTTLDVSKNTALTELNCSSNQLTSLDVSKNTALTRLECIQNQLMFLDLSNQTNLDKINISPQYPMVKAVISDDGRVGIGLGADNLDVARFTELKNVNGEMEAIVDGKYLVIAENILECPSWVTFKYDTRYPKETTTIDVYISINNLNVFPSGIVLNEEYFPDANFRAALAEEFGISEGEELMLSHIRWNRLSVLTSYLTDPAIISDLTGIEHFTALVNLFCYGLSCYGHRGLTSLDVSKNTALTALRCYGNQLTSLDVSSNTALRELRCYANQIKGEEMDALVASLPTVEEGVIAVIDTKDPYERNVCTKAQVAIAKAKGWIVYDMNGQDSGEGKAVEYEGSDEVQVQGVILNEKNFPDAKFRAILAGILKINEGDELLVKHILTKDLIVSGKAISDLTGIEHFTELKNLDCNKNKLTSLDVSQNVALTYLNCRRNQLTTLDMSQNTALTSLDCFSNQLTALDVSKNTALTGLNCSSNQLTALDVSKNTALRELACGYNLLTALDVSNNTALTTDFDCSSNQLTSLDVSGCTMLESLGCSSNQLITLDVSKNTALTRLSCSNNQLITLDVSKNTALTRLDCYSNQLITLDVSKNTALTRLNCHSNQLTLLDVSQNTALTELRCYGNKIKGEAMDALVNSLPTVEKGSFYVIDTENENEGNVITKLQVSVAKEKGWMVYDLNGWNEQEYEGSEDPVEDIDPVDEDDNIDFGSDMDENDDLNGNVIGDIFYNIGNGNGEYNAEEGCIVLKKTTDDETVDGLSGKDIFGEDFKGQFTGIVFKVPAGKGTVKVTAETTGNMLLKVKIGDNDPVEMELNGKLKISFPYNVSETTFVAIYAGAVNEAKGFGTTNATTDAALKIYGIEFERGETTAIDASLNDNGKMINDNYYSIDGKKLNGEPTKMGIYIYNGKKVKK